MTNAGYNGSIATGASTNFGFNGAWNNSANPVPADFALNGTACTGTVTTSTTTPTPTTTTAWTQDFSSGEAIRSGYDQNVTIGPCHLQYLYQGHDPSANQSYNLLPWRIGLATQTNSTC